MVRCAFVFAQIAIFACASLPAQAPATELRIRPLDESGRPLQLSRADLHLDIWGGGRLIPLCHQFPQSGAVRIVITPNR